MAVTTKRLNWLKWLYPGEAGLQSEQNWHIDKRRNHMKDDHSEGVVSGLDVLETSPTPDLEVHVQVGRAIGGDGEEILLESIADVDLSSYASGGATVKIVAEYAEQGTDPYIVPETSTSQDKFTQDVPTITAITGAPAANQIVLAQVVVSNGATQITDAINPANPGTNEIDLRDRIESNVRGLRLVKDLTGDAELSAVTVGEHGCDFNDLERALAYIDGLSRDLDRQCVVYLFGKSDGQDWIISSGITVPSWTRFVGVGRPTIKSTMTSGTMITLSEGSSIENMYIEVTASGWTVVIFANSNDVRVEDVSVRNEVDSVEAGSALHLGGAVDGAVVRKFQLLPYSSDSTKGCQGIYCQAGGTRINISDCDLRGDQRLLRLNSLNTNVSNVVVVATGTTSAAAVSFTAGNIAGLSVTLNAAARVVFSSGAKATGVVVKYSSPNSNFGVTLSNTSLSDFEIENCRVQLSTNARISNGEVKYTVDDGNEAIQVSSNFVIIRGVRVDRGSPTSTAPCIGQNADADYGVVGDCILTNSNGPSIRNDQAGVIDWMVSGNIVDVATPAGNGWVIGDEKVI